MTFDAWVQSRLTAHGYAVGPIDGKIGAITRAALGAFQQARGLTITGTVTDATVSALRLPSSQGVTRPEPAAPPAPAPASAVWPRQADCMAFYGPVGTGQTLLDLPYPMRLAWALDTVVTRISLHAKVAGSAERAFDRIASEYAPGDRAAIGLDIFGGSLNVRRMRGGSAWSMHSWGVAIDFDPIRNQLRWKRDASSYVVTDDDGRKRTVQTPPARLAQPDAEAFWRAWEEEGWISLGRTRDMDHMHIQAARL